MLFNSAIFGAFIAVVLALYWAFRGSQSRKWLLLLASYAFYAHWDYRYLALLALSTVVDFAAGRQIPRARSLGGRRAWLLASLITNLGILAVFKYGNFLVESVAPLWSLFEVAPVRFPENIPVGISFYTFQTMSYSIDVYRDRRQPSRSPLEFALYVSFFAQLVAGPIVRSYEFLPQVRRLGDLRGDDVAQGIQRFLLGLFKKVVLADNVGLFVDTVFANPQDYGAVTLWCASYGFALQIYCDFSGYSDMALGIGRALGIRLPENFNAPYLARSMTEFWRRWHISLSTWLRDYLYIPLGGSRRSRSRTYVNLMITMLLGGLWHGANWTFVLWGGFHGLLLAVERGFGVKSEAESRGFGSLLELVRALFTFHLVCIGWVLFRAATAHDAWLYVQRMFSSWTWIDDGMTLGLVWAIVLIALTTGQYLNGAYRLRTTAWVRLPAPVQGLALAVLVVLVAMWHVDEIAFIYFQF